MSKDLRFLPLDRTLLDMIVAEERDPLTAEMCSGEACAERLLAIPGLSWAMLGRGRVLVAGGVVPHWPGRAEAWWLVSRMATARDIVAATWRSGAFLDQRQRDPTFRRVEMFCRAGERWNETFPRRLGFTLEGRMRKWDALGRDHLLFARVKEA